MTATAKGIEAVVDLLREHAVGKTVRSLDVHGINSLKTQEPPLSSLTGRPVLAVDPSGDAVFTVLLPGVRVVIDLQRVGGAQVYPRLEPWTFGAGAQPTMRLLLADGSGIDLKEPSKTKRITVNLISSAPASFTAP